MRLPGSKPKQAVILAGGRGTRLRPLTDTLPKPMIAFHGRPFLEYLIESLRDQGIEEVLLLLGYLPEKIAGYFGGGSGFGIRIAYSCTDVDDDTGARLRAARDRIDPLFLFMYCDNYHPLDIDLLAEQYHRMGRPALTTVYKNDDGYTKNNAAVEDGLVVKYDKARRDAGLSGVDIGYGLFARELLDYLPQDGNPSFEALVYPKLVEQRQLAAFVSEHRYYSVGSFERLHLTEEFLARRKTVFIDRDGTLNERMPPAQYVRDPAQWRWLPGALAGLAALTGAGYRVIVVTNQPGIARGEVSPVQLELIHKKMVDEAAAAGATIDEILVCPHGWDEGCSCRKPSPGLLFEAQRRLSLDLSRVTFIGDDERDEAAAGAAGCPFIYVSDQTPFSDAVATLLRRGERPLHSAYS